jgi:hypothetical protein
MSAASIHTGVVSAYDAMRMLQHGGQPTQLGDTLAHFGRIFKTLHVLAYVDPVSYRRNRSVPIHPELAVALEAWLAARHSQPGANNTTAVFLNRAVGRMSARTADAIIGDSATAAGVADLVTPHVFRHSFGTDLIRSGTDVVTVAEPLRSRRIGVGLNKSTGGARPNRIRARPLGWAITTVNGTATAGRRTAAVATLAPPGSTRTRDRLLVPESSRWVDGCESTAGGPSSSGTGTAPGK